MALADYINEETMMTSPAESPQAIQGTGGGLGDMVPAMVDGQEPAALSEGEFVWPADVVSMLGDGSTEAGSRVLVKLMDKIREAKSKSNGAGGQADPIAQLLGA